MTPKEQAQWAAGYTARLARGGWSWAHMQDQSEAWCDGYAMADYNLSLSGSFVKLAAQALAEELAS